MFVPIHDRNPLKTIRYQYVTVGLIAVNVFVYFVFETGWFVGSDEQAMAFGLIPAQLLQASPLEPIKAVIPPPVAMPERWTLISYMFLHGNFLHLAGNMLFKRLSAPNLPFSHLVGLALLALLVPAAHSLTPLVLAAAVTLVLIIVVIWEWRSVGPGRETR